MAPQTHAMYLSSVLTKPRETLEQAVKKLEGLCDNDTPFDAIVCTGVSGLLLAPMVALTMAKRLAVIRKEGDVNHSEFRVETTMKDGDSWIFLDDLIVSGATLHAVRDTMQRMGFGKEVGTYLYAEDRFQNTAQAYDFWLNPNEMLDAEIVANVGNPS